MQDFKKVEKNLKMGKDRNNIFLMVVFGVVFLLSLGAVLERKYSITAKASAVVGNISKGAVALLPEKEEFPTVYKRWGDDKDCSRATLRGKPITCKEAMEKGRYLEEWIPYEK